MLERLRARCIDMNTPFCPCILAETNHCVFCSHLHGNEMCDCNWQGVCILYQKKWQGNHKASAADVSESKSRRWEGLSPIMHKQMLSEHICKLVVRVPQDLAQILNSPGSFVFLRREEDSSYFQMPLGVMDTHDDSIEILIEDIGVKSSRIVSAEQNLFLRGPFSNGLFGQPWVEKLTNGKVLLISGGMGQPPALLVAKNLVQNKNKVTAILSPGAVGSNIVAPLFNDLGINVMEVASLRRHGIPLGMRCAEQNFDLIVSCGPDAQHNAIIKALNENSLDIPMAATNNAVMCCGEGICGSCDKKTRQGTTIRTCKVQSDYRDIMR